MSDVHDRDILDWDLAIDTNYLPEERTRPPLKHASVDALSIDWDQGIEHTDFISEELEVKWEILKLNQLLIVDDQTKRVLLVRIDQQLELLLEENKLVGLLHESF